MELLSIEEVAQLLSLGRSTVYAMAKQGMIPVIPGSKPMRVSRQALEEWARAQVQPFKPEK